MLENSITCRAIFFSFALNSTLFADNLGSLLFHGNCITCHNETKAISAPSALEIQINYLRAFPQKKDFIAYMSTWVVHPNKQTSIMLASIKKYELMPELGFDKSTIEIIAEYIYETDFKKKHEEHLY